MQDTLQITQQTYTLLNGEYTVMHFPYIESHIEYLYGLIFIAVSMSVIAILRVSDSALFKNIMIGMFKYKNAENLLGTGFATLGHRLLLLTISLLTISILLTYLLTGTLISQLTPLILIILLFVHYFTILIYKYLGWTFNNTNIAVSASMSLWLSNISYGTYIAPFVISLFFTRPSLHPLIIKAICCTLIFLFIIRILRWIRILFQNRVFIFYMFLYLCGLEIVPIFLLVKMVVQ